MQILKSSVLHYVQLFTQKLNNNENKMKKTKFKYKLFRIRLILTIYHYSKTNI